MSRYIPGPLAPRIRAEQHLANRQRERDRLRDPLPEPTAPFALLQPPLSAQAIAWAADQILRALRSLRALASRRT